jgi:hypothetical protein
MTEVRACGYVRVSTDEQAERGHSIGEQERLICEVAAPVARPGPSSASPGLAQRSPVVR